MNSSTLDCGAVSVTEIRRAIAERGHWFMPWATPEEVGRVIGGLGRTIFVADVKVMPDSKADTRPDRAVRFHTDHHRADLIAWHYVEQTDEGGETVLLDGHELLRRLRPNTLERLRGLRLFEPKVFERESERFPFLSHRHGREKIYYPFWMTKEIEAKQREALLAFKRLTEQEKCMHCLLQPGDLLVIDNGRMLHGRTAISGMRRRFVRRYWIEERHRN